MVEPAAEAAMTRRAKINIAVRAVVRAKIQNFADEFVPEPLAFNSISFRTSAKGALVVFTDALEHHKRDSLRRHPRGRP